ncbi:unnamed protein product [Candidatus Protochlamydia amoebophila UWE25]|uniref:Uncharacterized protein n=1 Tax=Protochlamydia amoebophila (strain UWE25) TaxID=264201 RepID=Q6MC48_PARUW|nr:unnamed protein product [Candidatus Protochlamydia amoebophila UWE25]
MIRFIFNFILFGILFYLIYLFFPEAFDMLVSWVNQIYIFLREVFIQLSSKVHTLKREHINSLYLAYFR